MKKVELILMDNTANGPLKYSICSETTIGYKIPREFINRDMSESFFDKLKAPGVYVLVGKRAIDKNESIYVGQTDNVAHRLYEHKGGHEGEKKQGKMFWSECLAFVASDNQMQKGHAEYLELAFYKKAYEANRFILENENMPGEKSISEGDRIFCDDFIDDCDLLSTLMGVPIFSSLDNDAKDEVIGRSEQLAINNGNKRGFDDPRYVNSVGYICKTTEFDNGFMVLENSIIAKEVTKKAGNTIKKTRRELQKRGYIKEENNKLVFKREYLFPSAGIAASVVLGRSATSKEWK